MCVSGGGGRCALNISMGRYVPRKGVLFSVCLVRGVFLCKRSGKGFKCTYLESGSCLSGNEVVNYLSQELNCIW